MDTLHVNRPKTLKQQFRATSTSALVGFSIFLAACGGSDSSSDNTDFGSAGSTPFNGTWTVSANININAGGTADTLNQESTLLVDGNGVVGISTTNTDSSLSINFNGSRINYQTTTIVDNGVTGSGPCTITLTGAAIIVGSGQNASASGSFTPRTFICNGASISVTGNITGSKTVPET
ncbi:MAG: hypothetical protein ACRBEE_11045 [Arenicella sp.]